MDISLQDLKDNPLYKEFRKDELSIDQRSNSDDAISFQGESKQVQFSQIMALTVPLMN